MSSTILLYGKGKVGQSLARFCESIDQPYTLCDESDAPASFDEYVSIIPSPGLPSSHRVYQTDKIISELDYLFSSLPKGFQIHAVTGTDGKSTTSSILYHFLKAGFPDMGVYLGGNFGTPLADVLLEIQKKGEKEGHIVLEVSSFMSYHIRTFYAHNTILTNLHPDHLDWHQDLSEYYNAKLNLLAHTKNIILYPATVVSLLPDLPHFPIDSIALADDFVIENNLLPLTPEVFIDLSDTQLHGRHNAINIFFAASLAFRLGIPAKILSATLSTIPPLPHRLQKISTRGGRIWIEDSKSTTAQSLYAALEAFSPTRVHLIAGGKNKGDPFDGLVERLHNHCAQCVAIGETKSLFLQACHEAFVPCVSVATMQEAVDCMLQNTKEGDIIILSPGCSSFDMFKNYEDRAHAFIAAINAGE